MYKIAIALMVGAAILGTSVFAYGQVVREPPPSDVSAYPAPEELDVPTVLEDRCSFMTPVFGPDRSSPSVEATVQDMIEQRPTDLDNYLALLEGEPPDIAPQYRIVRTAAEESVAGRGPARPDEVLAVAREIDAYMRTNCER